MIEDLSKAMEGVAQPNEEVLKTGKINEEPGQNPYERLQAALRQYSTFRTGADRQRLLKLSEESGEAAARQRTTREGMRVSMRHVRRFPLKEHYELHEAYTTMQDYLKQMVNAREEVARCQSTMEIDKKALAYKSVISQFEDQTTKVQKLLGTTSTVCVVQHAKNVVDFMGHLKKFSSQPRLGIHLQQQLALLQPNQPPLQLERQSVDAAKDQ